MKKGTSKMSDVKKYQYLLIPSECLSMGDLSSNAKLVYGKIWAFGIKGCYQRNDILAKEFALSPRTVSRCIRELKNLDMIIWINSKSCYRHLWAKRHPKVRSALQLSTRAGVLSKRGIIQGNYRLISPGQKCQVEQREFEVVTRLPSHVVQVTSPILQQSNKGSSRIKKPCQTQPLTGACQGI